MYTVSLDSSSPAQCARLWQEVETTLGCSDDPLDILIAEEENGFDGDCISLNLNHHLNNVEEIK